MLSCLCICFLEVNFEADPAALESIMNETGIPDPPNPQLHFRHTLAATPRVRCLLPN